MVSSHLPNNTGIKYKGLRGILYIEYEDLKILDIPMAYGVIDIPIDIQNKRFINEEVRLSLLNDSIKRSYEVHKNYIQ